MSRKTSTFDGCSDIRISGGNFSTVGGDQTNNTNNNTNNTIGSYNTYTTEYRNSGNSTTYYPQHNTQNRNYNMGLHSMFPNPNQYHHHSPFPPWMMMNQHAPPPWDDNWMPHRGYSAPPPQPSLRNRPNNQPFDPMKGERRRKKPQPQPVYAETGFSPAQTPQPSRYPRHAPNPYPYGPQSEEFYDDDDDDNDDEYYEEFPSPNDARPYPPQTHTRMPQPRDPHTDTMYYDQSSQRNMAAPQPEPLGQQHWKANNPFAKMMMSENGNRERERGMDSNSAPPVMSMEADGEEQGRDPREYGTQTRRR